MQIKDILTGAKSKSLLRAVLLILTVFFISMLRPQKAKPKYNYEINSLWDYEDIVLKSDIPLLKSDQELDKEKEEIIQNFIPFYKKDEALLEIEKIRFDSLARKGIKTSQNINKELVSQSKKYIDELGKLLDSYYEVGIIKLDTNAIPPSGWINLIEDKSLSKHQISKFIPIEKITSRVKDDFLDLGASLPNVDILYIYFLEALTPNIRYDSTQSGKALDDQLSDITLAKGVLKKGTKLVTRNQVVDPVTFDRLNSYFHDETIKTQSTYSNYAVSIGYFVLFALLMVIFWIYALKSYPERLQKIKNLLFILLFFLAFTYLTYAVETVEGLSVYIVPFAIIPIVIRTFFSNQLALFVYLFIILVASLISTESYEFTVIQILAGIAAILSKPDAGNWSAFFRSMIWIFLTYIISFYALELVQDGSFNLSDLKTYIFIFLNVLLCLLAFPFIPLLERLFGFTSNFTLMELSDLNHPLLKRLATEASGTLQHSMQVANLSEAAAEKIGANSLLVKVAALYHDIGKIKNPSFFIENQASGVNLHDNETPLASAKIIINHVIDGKKMAEKNGLPAPIIHMISSHHGDSRVEYFYQKALSEVEDKNRIEESSFRYPGPKPKTKEETILMICDSIEAASKSLNSPDESDIKALVSKIINGKLEHGQLSESEITFHELELIKEVIISRLVSIYHVRIEYPEEKKG